MVLKILLVTAILLQFVAVVAALRLMRVTKYNVAWILFTVALVTMNVQLLGQYVNVSDATGIRMSPDFFAWMAVATSFCFAVGQFFVNQIFNYIGKTEAQRRLTQKRLVSTVLRTEEKERMRFAKELHDGMGPLLSSAKMQLSSLRREDMTPENIETIENAGYVIDEAMRSLREISNNLSPHVLKDFGLARAISNFVAKAQTGDIEVKFDTNLRGERFDIDVETILYRVVCELINNSLKHSGCSAITIDMRYDGVSISLGYADNGCGFNPDAVLDVGMGLSNITSRISSLKGDCTIESGKDRGMKAAIKVDLNNANGHRNS